MFLAELGAEVIKVEAPDGDPSRQVGPHRLGKDDSEYFQAWNLGKKSVTLDIKSAEGRRAVRGAGEDAPTASSTTCAARSRPSSASTMRA